MAAARHERRLLVVACKPLLGAGAGTGVRLDTPPRWPPLPPSAGPRPHALGAPLLAGPARLGAAWDGTSPRLPWPPATPPLRPARHAPREPSRPAAARGAPAVAHPRSACRCPGSARPRGHAQALVEASDAGGATRVHGLETPPGHRPTSAWGYGGPVPEVPPAASRLTCRAGLGLPVPWGNALRAEGSLHALAERRPASGGAPTRGQMPSQVEQGFLASGVSSGFCLPRPWRPTLGFSRHSHGRLQTVVRLG